VDATEEREAAAAQIMGLTLTQYRGLPLVAVFGLGAVECAAKLGISLAEAQADRSALIERGLIDA
jgi:hypothetical protein